MPTILVLGVSRADACDDAELDRRCRLATELWRRTRDARVVACGGRQKGDREPEAVILRRRLVELDIDADHILLEDRSRTTMENLRGAASLLGEGDGERVLVVTSDYHAPRVRLIARRLGLTVAVHGAKIPFSAAKLRRMLLEILCMADIILGFQDPGAKKPAWRRAVMALLGQDKP